MKELKITDRVYLKQDGNNVTIFERVLAKKKDSEETYIKEKDISYCGTIYQAIQHLIRSEYDIEEDLIVQFKEWISLINKAEEDIKKTFRLEVKTS